MATIGVERVLALRHWNDSLFSFTTTRDRALRFENGQFVMVGLVVDGKPLLRAYSVASANYEEHLEFLSIKVASGRLTSRLQHLKRGDEVLVSRKPSGTLVLRDLLPGRRLYLLCTGTGLAPFLSLIKDPETYSRFGDVVLAHGVRRVSDLAYRDYISDELPRDEFLGDTVRAQLSYYPTVTREAYPHQGRITTLIESGRLFEELGLPPLDARDDRVMVCGSPHVLEDCRRLLDGRGFRLSPQIGEAGDYVIERAFVDR
ncbi:MAG TPA: ferredoxin--NADP reductase [Rhodocyclaceae bacterium]